MFFYNTQLFEPLEILMNKIYLKYIPIIPINTRLTNNMKLLQANGFTFHRSTDMR